jgi:ParB family chromosome partitioning protein
MDTETAPAATYKKGKLYDLPIVDLKQDPNQPRKSMDPQALEELVASIKTHGIIQPILFRVAADSSTLVIVAGERRYKAAQLAGLTTLPGICVEGNPSEIALVENLLRQDLTAVEEAEGLQSLMSEQKYTQEQLSGVIGKARTTLSEILSLNKLPQEVRDDCRGDRSITRATLITIAKKKQARAMTTAYLAFKARQQKGKTTRTKKDANAYDTVSGLVGNAMKRLSALDTAGWEETDMETFRADLLGLKEWIDAFLAPAKR